MVPPQLVTQLIKLDLGVRVSTFMFLVSLEQVLSTAHILSQLICVNSSLHIISPARQILVISQE